MDNVHYNISPFNSWKALIHSDRMWNYLRWLEDPFIHLDAPVTIEMDLVAACNHKCWFCIAEPYMRRMDNINRVMPNDVARSIITSVAGWRSGVKAIVFIGGGEPTLHSRFPDFVDMARAQGMETALVTNGSMLHRHDVASAAAKCRWIGISIDAGTELTYKHIHRTDLSAFRTMMRGVRSVKAMNSDVHITYKYVMSPWNIDMDDLTEAYKEANGAGFDAIYYRPASIYHMLGATIPETGDLVSPEFEDDFYMIKLPKAIALLQGWLDVTAIDVGPTVSISTLKHYAYRNPAGRARCRALPLLAVFGGGHLRLCCDLREDPALCGPKLTADPSSWQDFWGSDEHRDMVRRIDVRACPRCRLSVHNEIIEHAFMRDEMNRNFV